MKLDIMEERVIQKINESVSECIKGQLTGYHSPLKTVVDNVLDKHKFKIESIVDDGVSRLLDSKGFELAIKDQLNKKLAQTLVSRMGGELEKQVNLLKQNPQTRAKITLAIDKVISEIQS